jgi:hypothetical protein
MSDSDDDLYEQVVQLLDGDNANWIRRASTTGVLKGLELLAVILYVIRDEEDKTRDPKNIVRDWAPALMQAIQENMFIVYDCDSYFPIQSPQGFNWVLSLESADMFIEDHGGIWTCSTIVISLFREKFPKEANEHFNSGEVPHEYELASKKKRWSDADLKLLWNESQMPGVTHKLLAEKHHLSRQRISTLLKQAKQQFSWFHKSPSISPKRPKLR